MFNSPTPPPIPPVPPTPKPVPPLNAAGQTTPLTPRYSPPPAVPPLTPATGVTPPSTANGEIHTMPTPFMPPKQRPHQSSKKKRLIIISAIVLSVLLIISAIIVYAFRFYAAPEETTEDLNNTANIPVNNANTNKNTNINTTNNANSNSNAANNNVNANTNTNANFNLNTNTNANANLNTNTNTNTNTNAAVPTSRENITVANDKDRDTLTDEEENLYGTKATLPDTDKDGYVDGTEIENLYSPLAAGETLIKSGLAIKYENNQFGWSILYPNKWVADALDETKREVLFTSDTQEGELIEVMVTDNLNGETAGEWYTSLYPTIEPEDLEEVEVNGLSGIITPDGYTYYLADSNYIFTITYNFGTKEVIHFPTTLKMMVMSFKVKGATEEELAD